MEIDNGGERYERYIFDATEDDHFVADILVDLENLINNSKIYKPTWSTNAGSLSQPLWNKKRKRSVLESPPSPARVHHAPPRIEETMGIKERKATDKEEFETDSPSSPLCYGHNEAHANAHNNTNNIHSKQHLKNKSKKRKLEEWEEYVKELEQTKQQLQLSLDSVKRYHQTLLDMNAKLKAKRDEKNCELKRENPPLKVNGGFDLNLKSGPGPHQFTPIYYPVVPIYQVNNDKVLQAAEARHRRRIKINTKRRSSSLVIRSAVS